MTRDLFDAVSQWQQDSSSTRSVSIELGKGGVRNDVAVWCFDYKIMEGNFIETIEDLEKLDLVKQKRDRVLREFQKLQVSDEYKEAA